jgi:hypothetical protein
VEAAVVANVGEGGQIAAWLTQSSA